MNSMISLPILVQLASQTSNPGVNVKSNSVTIAGHYAYVASAVAATVSIYDIYNPLTPVLKSQMTTLAGAYSVVIQGNYMYVPSSGSHTLYIVDISNPTLPVIKSSYIMPGSNPGSLYTCVVQGNYCYISTQTFGLYVVDVTSPTAPNLVYTEGGTLNKSFGIAINGNTLYTTNFQTAAPWTVRYLKTWDITTPTAPVLKNTYTLPANTKPLGVSLDVLTATAYVTDSNSNLIHVIDITTPTAPVFLTSLTPTGLFNSAETGQMALQLDTFVYVPSGSLTPQGGAIDIFDMSVRNSPIKITTVYTNVSGSVFGGVDLEGSYIYAADYGVAPGSTCTLDVFINKIPGARSY